MAHDAPFPPRGYDPTKLPPPHNRPIDIKARNALIEIFRAKALGKTQFGELADFILRDPRLVVLSNDALSDDEIAEIWRAAGNPFLTVTASGAPTLRVNPAFADADAVQEQIEAEVERKARRRSHGAPTSPGEMFVLPDPPEHPLKRPLEKIAEVSAAIHALLDERTPKPRIGFEPGGTPELDEDGDIIDPRLEKTVEVIGRELLRERSNAIAGSPQREPGTLARDIAIILEREGLLHGETPEPPQAHPEVLQEVAKTIADELRLEMPDNASAGQLGGEIAKTLDNRWLLRVTPDEMSISDGRAHIQCDTGLLAEAVEEAVLGTLRGDFERRFGFRVKEQSEEFERMIVVANQVWHMFRQSIGDHSADEEFPG
ncbi:hypothetical protein QLT00_gp03 [Gordonia phage Commandaria]|uniref:Uncharacterized protein n=1 Tax=Gordonia phage Commandaria TaxID=3038364 RepID=A0AAF0K7E1_9CAUD|nr:hypothetical protein QLT00_gp03 [Gordonia phage Commandaria]WGH20786.1 hypothetical protein [Gordonia phage Commandaria]